MTMRFLGASLTVACLGLVTLASARPPDLPVPIHDIFAPEGQTTPAHVPSAVSVKPHEAAKPAVMSTEAEGLELLRWLRENHERAHHGDGQHDTSDELTIPEAQSRTLYVIGRKCQDKGDLDMAQNCFQECSRLCPDGEYGRLANERLQEMLTASIRDQVMREADAQSLYFIGEHCLRNKDFAMAKRCYDEAVQVCESSEFARLAANRLAELARFKRDDQGGAEESTDPPVASQPRDLDRALEARDLFLSAQKLDEKGRRREAIEIYWRAYHAYPECTFGRQALQRIEQLSVLNGKNYH